MLSIVRLGTLAGALLLGTYSTSALACDGHSSEQAGLKKITIEQLTAMQKDAGAVQLFDANTGDTRTKYGVIPGATLLTSYAGYDVGKELPTDKAQNLVFYCGGPKCQAAFKAAQRALEAGYTKVFVLDAGIRGWAEAKLPVDKPAA